MAQVILVSGRKGTGKDEITKYLTSILCKNKKIITLRFAETLKDCLAVMFSWERSKLDGLTEEDRKWREQEDEYWTKKLKRSVTPRNMMEYFGTDMVRAHFGNDFWVFSVHKKINELKNKKEVIVFILPDTRFWNEHVETRKEFKTFSIHVNSFRTPFPSQEANIINQLPELDDIAGNYDEIVKLMAIIMRDSKIHRSDYECILIERNIKQINDSNQGIVIENDFTTLKELHSHLQEKLKFVSF